jgi:D-glycero-D-manno-heptose 1,7-bisphosphate phosphatase
VLIDRDGTLNVEKQYLSHPDQLEFIPGSAQALKRLEDRGIGVCVLTNQSAIARGYFDQAQLNKVHERLVKLLANYGVALKGIYYCPHAPDDNCDCRKPMPGMIFRAMADHHFNASHAWVIGDKESDVQMGRAVGAKTILVRTGYGKEFEPFTRADYVVDDLSAAVELILSSA